jgi:nicotinamide-nucleotide amidase
VLRESLERADVVVTIGGLGPTMDDLTRDAIAAAMDDRLERIAEYEAHLREIFSTRKIRWTETIARQADKPTCAEFIENPNGTAPGLVCRKGGKTIVALPGPKNEFDPMAQGPVRKLLAGLGGGVIHSHTLRILGLGESHVEDLVRDLMEAEAPTVAPYAHIGEVHLRITARASSRAEADAIVEPVEREIRNRLGKHVYGMDGTSLEAAILELLTQKGHTLSVAESMTGGELGGRLSAAPGASKAFVGGIIAYSARVKQAILGVDGSVIEREGPVSERVAIEMARGARKRLGSTFALAITGNAGPASDVDGKPVGLVYVALAHESGHVAQEKQYGGDRASIRARATQQALVLLRDHLAERP